MKMHGGKKAKIQILLISATEASMQHHTLAAYPYFRNSIFKEYNDKNFRAA
jgi:hypothetical protein